MSATLDMVFDLSEQNLRATADGMAALRRIRKPATELAGPMVAGLVAQVISIGEHAAPLDQSFREEVSKAELNRPMLAAVADALRVGFVGYVALADETVRIASMLPADRRPAPTLMAELQRARAEADEFAEIYAEEAAFFRSGKDIVPMTGNELRALAEKFPPASQWVEEPAD